MGAPGHTGCTDPGIDVGRGLLRTRRKAGGGDRKNPRFRGGLEGSLRNLSRDRAGVWSVDAAWARLENAQADHRRLESLWERRVIAKDRWDR